MNRLVSAFSIIIAFSGASVSAQVARKAPPLPSPEQKAGPERDLFTEEVARAQGVPLEEARSRAAAIRSVHDLVRQAMNADPQAFAGVWVDDRPFRIVVSFVGQEERKAFLESLAPSLRRYVQLRVAKRSEAQVAEDIEDILKSVQAAKIPFEARYDQRSERFQIIVATQDAVQAVRDLVPPRLRSEVSIDVGPTLAVAQSNIRTGDALYGGWDLVNADGAHRCTYGFAGRDSYGRDAILTAGHCAQSPAYVLGVDEAHRVQLPAPTDSRYGDLYDFRHHPAVGLQTGYWVYFKNNFPVFQYENTYRNDVPGFYADGYFTVSGTLQQSQSYNSFHYLGMPVCKHGWSSGFTCGKVVNNWVGGTDSKGVSYRGFVKVGESQQRVIAWAGDSGAPVFSYPDTGYNIVAYGLLKGGEPTSGPCVGTACTFTYMPIDRVNDATPFNIYTTQGLRTP